MFSLGCFFKKIFLGKTWAIWGCVTWWRTISHSEGYPGWQISSGSFPQYVASGWNGWEEVRISGLCESCECFWTAWIHHSQHLKISCTFDLANFFWEVKASKSKESDHVCFIRFDSPLLKGLVNRALDEIWKHLGNCLDSSDFQQRLWIAASVHYAICEWCNPCFGNRCAKQNQYTC